jgi:3-phenylpropionate/trans-cinnamate dioxygenase ferredoxin subunit
MAWFEAAAVDELQPGQMKRLETAGRKLLLCNAEGDYFCVDEMCSHEDYSLWFGCIKGKSIKCSLHGSYFDLASGKPLNEPADCPLKTYAVKLEGGRVWVDSGA